MQDFTNDRESSRVRRPQKLLVTVQLPGVESASCVDLDIYRKRLTLECAKPLYKLDVSCIYFYMYNYKSSPYSSSFLNPYLNLSACLTYHVYIYLYNES